MKTRRSGLSVRVGVVIVRDGRILLARHFREGRDYWVVPGGHTRSGESVIACGRREILEETGIEVTVGPLLYLADFSGEGFHVVDLLFLADSCGGEAVLGDDPEDIGALRVLREVRWHPLARLDGVALMPEGLKTAVIEDWPGGFARRGIYIGHHTTEG